VEGGSGSQARAHSEAYISEAPPADAATPATFEPSMLHSTMSYDSGHTEPGIAQVPLIAPVGDALFWGI
jgi:hypothetical protein